MRYLVGFAIAMLLWSAVAQAAAPHAIDIYPASRMLPQSAFADAGGQTIDLASFRGRPVLLHFFATWCIPCRDETLALQRLQRHFPDRQLTVVMLSLDTKGLPAVRRFYDTLGIQDLDAYFDPGGTVARAMAVRGLPSTIIVNPDGRDIGRVDGVADWDDPSVIAMLTTLAGVTRTPAPESR